MMTKMIANPMMTVPNLMVQVSTRRRTVKEKIKKTSQMKRSDAF